MREALQALTGALRDGRPTLLCQVVETRGSTPQKAGALMAVDPDGGQVGTLGGGCVEAEVKQKALRRLGRRGAELHEFLLDHDYAWADGLICGGKMVILAECVSGLDALDYYGTYLQLLERGKGLTEQVALVTNVGARWLHDDLGSCVASLQAPIASGPAAPAIDGSTRVRPGVHEGVAYLPVHPRVCLLIVGAGHVGQAVAELASRVDFDVWVVDDRKQYANSERFPSAQNIIVGPIESTLRSLDIDTRTYAVIVTRGHGHDQEALACLAPTAALYVGLIGSRRKIRMIFESLRAAGMEESVLERVSSPIGFDIGSESVPEIAVSIVAELIARRNLGRARRAAAACTP